MASAEIKKFLEKPQNRVMLGVLGLLSIAVMIASLRGIGLPRAVATEQAEGANNFLATPDGIEETLPTAQPPAGTASGIFYQNGDGFFNVDLSKIPEPGTEFSLQELGSTRWVCSEIRGLNDTAFALYVEVQGLSAAQARERQHILIHPYATDALVVIPSSFSSIQYGYMNEQLPSQACTSVVSVK